MVERGHDPLGDRDQRAGAVLHGAGRRDRIAVRRRGAGEAASRGGGHHPAGQRGRVREGSQSRRPRGVRAVGQREGDARAVLCRRQPGAGRVARECGLRASCDCRRAGLEGVGGGGAARVGDVVRRRQRDRLQGGSLEPSSGRGGPASWRSSRGRGSRPARSWAARRSSRSWLPPDAGQMAHSAAAKQKTRGSDPHPTSLPM